MSDSSTESRSHIETTEAFGAHNYHPLPVVVARGEGPWVHDTHDNRYLDMLSAYSAVNFGHGNARLLHAARRQLERVTLTSRAFYNDRFGPFASSLARLCGMEAVLPMNSGAEAVETAIKVARKWAYDVKGVGRDAAKIIVCSGNFHGRTTTIVSFSDDAEARDGFGPYTPGFVTVAYGDIDSLRNAIDADTAAFLIEPIQGEAGVVIPSDEYLREARELCRQNDVLFIADEIQSGLGRTGKTFAVEHAGVRPDMFILGKALGGGIYPLSAVVTSRAVIDVVGPGQHGSTFGGNPLACAIGLEVVSMMNEGEMQSRAEALGAHMRSALDDAHLSKVVSIRSRGLWFGIDIDPGAFTGRRACEALMAQGVLAKDTHGSTIRLSPPLVIERDDIDWAVDRIGRILG